MFALPIIIFFIINSVAILLLQILVTGKIDMGDNPIGLINDFSISLIEKIEYITQQK